MKIIVALCKNYGIGLNNKLPWKIRHDLIYFKNKTIGDGNNAVLMGKNTWNSLPKKPLPNRMNCVLSTSLNLDTNNSKSFKNSKDFDEYIEKNNFDDVWVIGGEKIYNKYIYHPKVNELYITKIRNDILCDTYFPEIPFYFELSETSKTYNQKNIQFCFEIYKKKI